MYPKQQKLSLKNRALHYLSLREHSRLELGRKLARHAEEGEDVEALLDFLEKSRFLSSERFSESLVRRRAENYGNKRILAELQTHGLNVDVLERSKAELAETEVARACAVWQKKFGRGSKPEQGTANESDSECGPCDANAYTIVDKAKVQSERNRQIRYLMQRGFSSKAIKIAMRGDIEELDEF